MSEMTWKHFVQKWKHLRIHGNFLETSEFCPKRFPMRFFDVLVGEGGRFQLIGAIKKTRKPEMALKKAFWGVFQLEPIKARFSALIGWNRSKLYWVSCIEVRHI